MEEEIIITPAKRLGWLNQPDFCEGCFYVQKLIGFSKPWPIPMPIYTALDRIQKHIVQQTLDKTGGPPTWLHQVGDVVGYIEPPHYSKFSFDTDVGATVRVRGQADLILKLANGNLAIVDLKTSKSAGRDALLPTYHVQQNAYARAAEAQGLGTVESVSLLYLGIDSVGSIEASISDQAMDAIAVFDATYFPLELDPTCIEPLCERYKELYLAKSLPKSRDGCKECEKIEYLLDALRGTPKSNASLTPNSMRAIYARNLGAAQ